jgi:hypothetical protein
VRGPLKALFNPRRNSCLFYPQQIACWVPQPFYRFGRKKILPPDENRSLILLGVLHKYDICLWNYYQHLVFILDISFNLSLQAHSGLGGLLVEVSRSHSVTPHSKRLLRTSDRSVADTSTRQHTTFTRQRHPCHWDRLVSDVLQSDVICTAYLVHSRTTNSCIAMGTVTY